MTSCPASDPEPAMLEGISDTSQGSAGDEPALIMSDGTGNMGMTRSQAFNLYTSHFLSTWNVRTYEFAAVSV